VSLILSTTTGSLWFQAHRLGPIPGSPGRWNSVQSGITRRGVNRHVR